jgi:hypothetical protein
MQDDNQGGAKNNGDVDLHEDLMVIWDFCYSVSSSKSSH